LSVKVGGRWRQVCEFRAPSHDEAFDEAVLNLRPEHQRVPMRLEQIELKRTRSRSSRGY
jgi:hypothetical protein